MLESSMNAAILGDVIVEEADDGATALQALKTAALSAQRLNRDTVKEFGGYSDSDWHDGDGFRNDYVLFYWKY
jgi:hypothetical protein